MPSIKSSILTYGHPVQLVSPRYRGSAIHSRAPLSSSGANQGTGWYLRAQSTPLHTVLTEKKERQECIREDNSNDEDGAEITSEIGRRKKLLQKIVLIERK